MYGNICILFNTRIFVSLFLFSYHEKENYGLSVCISFRCGPAQQAWGNLIKLTSYIILILYYVSWIHFHWNVVWSMSNLFCIGGKRNLTSFVHIFSISKAVVMEGKYWKRKLSTVAAEYKKWRLFYRNRIMGWNQKDSTPDLVLSPFHSKIFTFFVYFLEWTKKYRRLRSSYY